MKVAYLGCDLYLDCIDVFESLGYTICVIFITPSSAYNDKLIELATRRNIPIIDEKPTEYHVKLIESFGVELVYSCSYGWRIPNHPNIKYSLNVHPTLLPEGRGPNPLFWLVRNSLDCFGITFHKISDSFDQGDIIYQKRLALNSSDSIESLMMKLEIEIPKSLNECLSKLSELYSSAEPQSEGSFWPKVKAKDIIIEWSAPLEKIKSLVKAVGRFGAIAKLGEAYHLITDVEYSRCQHNFEIGKIVKEDSFMIAISIKDGVVIIRKCNILSNIKEDFLEQVLERG